MIAASAGRGIAPVRLAAAPKDKLLPDEATHPGGAHPVVRQGLFVQTLTFIFVAKLDLHGKADDF